MDTGASQAIERQGPSLWEEGRVRDPYELQRLYLDDVWRYVSARLDRKEDAEDVTMDVMAAAFERLRRDQAVAEPRLWLLTIAKNKVADALRRRYRRRETLLVDGDAAHGPDHLRRFAVNSVLDKMAEDQSQALVLKYVNGLSTEEVGAVLKRSPEAANSLLQRARQSFRELGAGTFDLTDREEEDNERDL
jgi:RNA polymerase sigma-70 factor (ECF subfamily)